jgi:hypothetical protein
MLSQHSMTFIPERPTANRIEDTLLCSLGTSIVGSSVMTNRIFALAAMISLAGSVLPVHAADLAPRPMMPAPTYNWTGIYVGVNGGGAWGQQDPLNVITDRFDEFSMNISGGMVGGTVGAQAQAGHVVLGMESDLDWTSISGSGTGTTTFFGAPLAPSPSRPK